MIVIACVDDKGGMMFNHRRQSQDQQLRDYIAHMTGNARLWMNHYSASQFDTDSLPRLNIDESFLQEAVEGDYCFVENTPLAPYERWIEKIILFKWNRTYPADKYFDIDLASGQWHKVDDATFVGHSHDEITMEVYIR